MDTEIFMILDRSGSMASVATDTIGGVNEWLKTTAKAQKQGDAVNISVTIFDTIVDQNVKSVAIRACPKLGSEGNPWSPRGMTALRDAVGETLTAAKKLVPKGKRGLAVIVTDGYENASRRWSEERLGKLMEQLEKSGRWSFVYLGSGIDAWANAKTVYAGTQSAQTTSYDPIETRSAYSANAGVTAQFLRGTALASPVLGAETAQAMGQTPTFPVKPKPARKVAVKKETPSA